MDHLEMLCSLTVIDLAYDVWHLALWLLVLSLPRSC
jgi:hypothetical protein